MCAAEWIKASLSTGMAACVELRRDADMVAVRNSRRPEMEQRFTRVEFAAFLDGAKRGEFDHLLD